MRNVDSVLIALARDEERVATRLGHWARALGRRAESELRLLVGSILPLGFVAALSVGIAALCHLIHSWAPATGYVAALVVPVTGVLFAMVWTTCVRIVTEPRRVSNTTLALVGLCAYGAAWLLRARLVGFESLPVSAETIEWALASRASDLGSFAWLAPHYMVAEGVAVVSGGLALTRLYLGAQPSYSRPGA